MMMGALAAGGLPAVTDGVRVPDEHNPVGYFEHEAVKTLERDARWLQAHRGQAIKILFHKLHALPPDLSCRILFMERDLSQVVASQNAMLGGVDGTDWESLYSKEVRRVLRDLERGPHPHLRISHHQVIDSPEQVMTTIADFLALDLDVQAMVGSIRPDLHRQRGFLGKQ